MKHLLSIWKKISRALPENPPRPRRIARAFSLLELLVAVTILSVMVVFMFAIVSQTISTWEIGNRRIEAAQAARVGLNTIANDLQFAFAGNFVTGDLSGGNVTNVAPFFSSTNATSIAGSVSGMTLVPATNSDQIFVVRPLGDLSSIDNPLEEVGYLCTFVESDRGNHGLTGWNYALLRHRTQWASMNAFFRGPPTTNWINVPSGSFLNDRAPIIDNCIRFKLSYATNSAGPNPTLSFTDTWTNQTSLPRAVLAEVIVVDSKTMSKVKQVLRGRGSQLTDDEINSITNFSDTNTVPRLLRQGAVVMRRLIPMPNSR